MEHNNELKHYGTIGMKWGVRRARKKGTTYTYKSHGTKKYAKKAAKYEAAGKTKKQKKYEHYHKRSVDLDRKMQKNAESNSATRAVVKTFINEFTGNRTYEVTKAATRSRGLAFVNTWLTGPIGGTPVRALYVRSGKK